jgi:hypothetical protein
VYVNSTLDGLDKNTYTLISTAFSAQTSANQVRGSCLPQPSDCTWFLGWTCSFAHDRATG